jgi:hypothetical protein
MAGAAIERGIPTLSIADVNDPALPLAQVRGRTDGVLPIDDNLAPRAMLRAGHRGNAASTPARGSRPASAEVEVDAGAVADTLYTCGASRTASSVSPEPTGWPPPSKRPAAGSPSRPPSCSPTRAPSPTRWLPHRSPPRWAARCCSSVRGSRRRPRGAPRLGTQEVIVVGAIGAVPLDRLRGAARAGLDVRRIAGDSRFDTAALIAREVGASDGHAIVVSGLSFADALSVAPYAAAQRIPILLTGPDAVHPDTADALEELEVTQTVVVGGTAVVSDAALALRCPPDGGCPVRTATRPAAPSRSSGRSEDMSFEVLHVATGRDYPDALAAGPVAGCRGDRCCSSTDSTRPWPSETYALLAESRRGHRRDLRVRWDGGADRCGARAAAHGDRGRTMSAVATAAGWLLAAVLTCGRVSRSSATRPDGGGLRRLGVPAATGGSPSPSRSTEIAVAVLLVLRPRWVARRGCWSSSA